MEFIETSVFTKWLAETLADSSYKELQAQLIRNPEAGKLMKGCGGIRKIRWNLENRGKSGSVRIIYYYKVVAAQIFMLFGYSKKDQGDLTAKQRKMLAAVSKEL